MTDSAHSGWKGEAESVRSSTRLMLPRVISEVHGYRASDLQEQTFPPLVWAVPGLIPEGVTILGGKPKIGKSWLVLNLAVSVATGGVALGYSALHRARPVLYLSLEDSERRMSTRLSAVFAGTEPEDSWPPLLTIVHRWPGFELDGLDRLADWVTSERMIDDEPGLIIIDTYQLVRPPSKGRSIYAEDYRELVPLQRWARDEHVAVLLVHHHRKDTGADDWIDSLSGSTGMTGAIDTVAALFRERGRHDATLRITGRDVEDDPELALGFDKGNWRVLGAAAEYRLSVAAADVLSYLMVNGASSPKQVADALDRHQSATRKLMWQMANRGDLKSLGSGRYTVSAVPNGP